MNYSTLVPVLKNVATRLRIASLRATSEAGSGHPTSCCSAAEIVATLFFHEMRFDPANPRHSHNDRFVLSKGHAAPLLYAVWSALGVLEEAELLKLRRIDSDLEGHPTPRLPFVDVATGSLGQGICAAVGMALNARRIQSDFRTYVLLGDGESAEGAVWEAAQAAVYHKLENLCAVVDVNGFGQSDQTRCAHDLDALAQSWRGFGWNAVIVDGHEVQALLEAYNEARTSTSRPTVILARTLKGKGVSFLEDKAGWHGKPIKKGPDLEQAIAELEAKLEPVESGVSEPPVVRRPTGRDKGTQNAADSRDLPAPSYKLGEQVATREAYGRVLAALGTADPNIVVLDADVKNSTFSEKFESAHPDRFYQMFIAEQVMVGAAMGMASLGAIAFPSSFACFLSRASDFVRMAGISNLNIKLAGSHAGVSIGEDGPSQMALEDLAMMRAVPNCTVLYPCDAISTERLVACAAYQPGPAYIRTTRPKTPVIYDVDTDFKVGGSCVLRESDHDVATIVAAGVTIFESLQAYDDLKSDGVSVRVIDAYSIQPIDEETLLRAGRETRNTIFTVEDHYASGGLGDAVAEAVGSEGMKVIRLAVREIPRSGRADEVLDRYGISARHIVEAVRCVNKNTESAKKG